MQQPETPKEETGSVHDQLSLGQVHSYTDFLEENGRVEYVGRAIHVVSKHPLDQCLRRGMIEPQHHDSGKRLRTIRDCAFSGTQGNISKFTSFGDGDGEVDAATLYKHIWPNMPPRQAELVQLICFAQPNVDGEYFHKRDYSFLFPLSPNIQRAFEELDEAISVARRMLKDRVKLAKEAKENVLQ